MEDAGLVAAAVNFTCYRGRTPHAAALPGVTRAAHGPKRFFYFNIFESDETGAPLGRARPARAVGRPLRRRGRPLARHARRLRLPRLLPPGLRLRVAHGRARTRRTRRSIARTTCVARAARAAGGPDALLERYAVVVCSDHGQTRVEVGPTSLHDSFSAAWTTRRRRRVEPGRHGLPPPRCDAPASSPSGSTAAGGRDGAVPRGRRAGGAPRGGEEGSTSSPQYPRRRSPTAPSGLALRNPNAGDVLVSPLPVSSSRTSAAATTPAAAATARSWPATRACRCSRRARAARRPPSPTSRRSCSPARRRAAGVHACAQPA